MADEENQPLSGQMISNTSPPLGEAYATMQALNSEYTDKYEDPEEGAYSKCRHCCGECPQVCCLVCACCSCGPVEEVEQGYAGIKIRFSRFHSKLKPGLHIYNPCSEKIL